MTPLERHCVGPFGVMSVAMRATAAAVSDPSQHLNLVPRSGGDRSHASAHHHHAPRRPHMPNDSFVVSRPWVGPRRRRARVENAQRAPHRPHTHTTQRAESDGTGRARARSAGATHVMGPLTCASRATNSAIIASSVTFSLRRGNCGREGRTPTPTPHRSAAAAAAAAAATAIAPQP